MALLVENIQNTDGFFLWHRLCILNELFEEKKKEGRRLMFVEIL